MSTAITSANPFGIFKLKKRNKNSILLLITVLSIGFWSCSSVTNNTELTSDADLDNMATEIMGSSISDQESGLMNSVYDGLSNVSATGISYGKNQSFLLKSIKKIEVDVVLKDLSVIAMTALPVYIHYLLNML